MLRRLSSRVPEVALFNLQFFVRISVERVRPAEAFHPYIYIYIYIYIYTYIYIYIYISL